MDLGKAKRISEQGPTLSESYIIVLPGNPSGLQVAFQNAMAWMKHWRTHGANLGVDVETSGLDFYACSLYSISLAEAEPSNTAIAFTLSGLHTLPWEMEKALTEELAKVLASDMVNKIYHNCPFDRAVLIRKGFHLGGRTLDTMAMHHLIQPDIHHDLGWVGHTFLDVEPWKITHDGNKKANTKDPAELLLYNAKDALYTAQLVDPLQATLHQRGISPTLSAWQMSFSDLATDMELVGLPVNLAKRRMMGMQLLRRMFLQERRVKEFLQWPDFNPMSSKHKIEVLFGEKYSKPPWNLGLIPTVYNEKDGKPSTSYKAIIDYMEHPLIAALVNYTELRGAYAIQYKDKPDAEIAKLRELGAEDHIQRWEQWVPCGLEEQYAAMRVSVRRDPAEPGSYHKAICSDGRLRCSWKPCAQKGSRFTSSPNCFDDKTEVLTTSGWLLFKDAEKCNSVPLQYDPDTGGADVADSFQYVNRPVKADTTVVHLRARRGQIDLMITKDHGVLVDHYVQKDYEKYQVRERFTAIDLFNRHLSRSSIPKRASHWLTGSEQIPWYKIAVLCACQADGWRRKYGSGEAWAFYFSKERKCIRLQEALRACKEEASWYAKALPRAGRKEQTAIYIRPCILKNWVDDLLGPKKEFGSYLLQWSTETLRLFCDEVTQWDGRHDRRTEYSSTIKGNVDWVQTAAAISGSRTGDVREFWGGSSKVPCYQMSAGPISGSMGFEKKHVKIVSEEYSQIYRCVTVPTGYIFVRRNGHIAICGNCQNQSIWHRAFFEAADGWAFTASDKDQVEARVLAARAGIVPLLTEMRKLKSDTHTMNAAVVYGDEFWSKSEEARYLIRAVTKNVFYAGIYLAGWMTVWRTCRENKRIDAQMRAAMTKKQVRLVHQGLFRKAYAGINDWHEKNLKQVAIDGYMEIPPFGRRRYAPVRPIPATEFANWSIQPAATDIVTSEIVLIQEELKRKLPGRAFVVRHGHDEVNVEHMVKDTEEVQKIIKRIFGNTYFDGPAGPVYLTAGIKTKKNLRDIKD